MSQVQPKTELTIIWAEEKAEIHRRLDVIELRLFNLEADLKALFNHLRVTPVQPGSASDPPEYTVTQPSNVPSPRQEPPRD